MLVPLSRPQPLQPDQAHFRQGEGCRVLPLRTHLLGPLDDAIDVLRTYAADLVQPGDILTICCLLYTSPSPRDRQKSRMPSSA